MLFIRWSGASSHSLETQPIVDFILRVLIKKLNFGYSTAFRVPNFVPLAGLEEGKMVGPRPLI